MGFALYVLLGGGFAWLLWRIFRHYVTTSSVDRIPGPPSTSFLWGESCLRSEKPNSSSKCCYAGNFLDMINSDNWAWLDGLANYPNVAKVASLLGVRRAFKFECMLC